MYLKKLHLHLFRNYLEEEVEFKTQKTIILGNNAQGKSNLLEAIELLSTLKSHRTSRTGDLVNQQAITGQIKATVERLFSQQELAITLRQQGKKTVTINGESLRRQIDFLGVLNAVQFSSLDLDLVRGSPEYRRNWVDGLLVQLEPIYAYILYQYNQVLRQRNALLKQIKKFNQDGELAKSITTSTSPELLQLELWDGKLAETGSRVTRRRARVLKRIAPIAKQWHEKISGKTENLEIEYTPNVNWLEDKPLEVQLAIIDKIKQRRIAEQQLGTTVVGPHRDEIVFKINGIPARGFGSSGQQRTLVLALKLAELKLIEEVVGEPPLLLLDDILAELDPLRQNQLSSAIGDGFQALITTTHLDSFNRSWLNNSQILEVEAGKFKYFV